MGAVNWVHVRYIECDCGLKISKNKMKLNHQNTSEIPNLSNGVLAANLSIKNTISSLISGHSQNTKPMHKQQTNQDLEADWNRKKLYIILILSEEHFVNQSIPFRSFVYKIIFLKKIKWEKIAVKMQWNI